jgi:hypothetical protein
LEMQIKSKQNTISSVKDDNHKHLCPMIQGHFSSKDLLSGKIVTQMILDLVLPAVNCLWCWFNSYPLRVKTPQNQAGIIRQPDRSLDEVEGQSLRLPQLARILSSHLSMIGSNPSSQMVYSYCLLRADLSKHVKFFFQRVSVPENYSIKLKVLRKSLLSI